jgi:threonine dehydratase
MPTNTVTFADVQAAATRLQGHAHRTPVHTSHTLNERIGGEVFLKCENLQRMGAFKFRGAYNAISQLTDAERARGVITYSSGNHAQAVALAGRIFGVKTTIVMPTDAPKTKRAATVDYGATVIDYNPAEQDRRQLAERLAEEHGYFILPPFDHPHVIAGQGTSALELFQDVPNLDILLVPCGGGGLLSGCAIATKGISPHTQIIGIEPELGDDATQSFKTKTLITIKTPPTIADGTRTTALGENYTFPLILQYVDAMQTVTEEAIQEAVRFAFYRLKLVIEPSGALGLSALLSGAVDGHGKRIGVIVSGGNIDADTFIHILNSNK